jgi:alkylhydroperoxidase/carboxymuconolactone decarboxylase family protein YurZ
MTTLPNPGTWQATLQKSAPELYQSIMGVRNEVLVEGALPLKIKVLMTMLCDALLAHEEGVHSIANRARAVGATVGVAFLMGGTPALVTAVNAFKK